MKLKSLAILTAVVALVGCTLPYTPISNPTPPATGITGNWELTVTSTQTPYAGTTMPIGIYLAAAGNSVSGTAVISAVCPAFGCGWPTLAINPQLSGTIDANGNLVLTSTNANGMIFSMTAKSMGTALENGTYTLSNSGVIDQGTVTGDWFPPLNGTYLGTVLSSNSGQSIGVTTTLNQTTTPDAKGIMRVTGSATITGEACFSAATMAGLAQTYSALYGSYFVVNLVTTNNPSIFINEFGVLSQDGKTIQFTYSVVDINGGKVCDNNDFSNSTLTLQ